MNNTQRDNHHIPPIRGVLISLLVTLALISFIWYLTYIIPEETEERIFTITMMATYMNKNKESKAWNFTEDDMTVSLFMNNSWQKVNLINSSHRIKRFKTDIDGNALAILDFPIGIATGANFSYEVTYQIVLKEIKIPEVTEFDSRTLNDIPEDLKISYCGSAGPWQVNDSRLKELAYEIAWNETKVLTIIRKIIVLIKEKVTYPLRSLEIPKYPNETFSDGVGDCDDQANLLITLCRIVGIPAFLQIGCIYMPQYPFRSDTYWNGHLISEFSNIGWHGWAMVYVPPWGWLPVDLTYVKDDLHIDPLNAIRASAIATAPTVQYINVTRADYVADSRDTRNFIITYNFYIYEYDTMNE